jgi:hypothetical protein
MTKTDRMRVVKHHASTDIRFANFIFEGLASELQYLINDLKSEKNISDEEIKQICPVSLLVCRAKEELENTAAGSELNFKIITTITGVDVEDIVTKMRGQI